MIEKIGIVGGGQLGRMLTSAAKPLGFEVVVVDPIENCPAAQVGADQIVASLKDPEAITELAERTNVVTWEIEHIDTDTLIGLHDNGYDIQPSPHTLVTIQDKLSQKRMLVAGGIPVAPFFDFDNSTIELSGPYVVKSRKGGYDGRGNAVVDDLQDPIIEEKLGLTGLYVEQKMDFDKEVAIVAARDKLGNIVTYPLVETIHKDNICHITIAPASVDTATARRAKDIAHDTLGAMEGAGVFAIEMFVVGDDVVVNEIAPRVHNSGHHTIEANITSQFEQHIRAIAGLPLGSTAMRAHAVMINILGTRDEKLDRRGLNTLLTRPDTHPHFYGKDSRPQRKVGHITVLAHSTAHAKERAIKARKDLSNI